jgi:hypothetical protein
MPSIACIRDYVPLLALLNITLALASPLLNTENPHENPNVFDVRAYGAVGDGTTMNTVSFAKVFSLSSNNTWRCVTQFKRRRSMQPRQITRSAAAELRPSFTLQLECTSLVKSHCKCGRMPRRINICHKLPC